MSWAHCSGHADRILSRARVFTVSTSVSAVEFCSVESPLPAPPNSSPMYGSAHGRSDVRYARITMARHRGSTKRLNAPRNRRVHYVLVMRHRRSDEVSSKVSVARSPEHDRTAPEHPIADILPGEARGP